MAGSDPLKSVNPHLLPSLLAHQDRALRLLRIFVMSCQTRGLIIRAVDQRLYVFYGFRYNLLFVFLTLEESRRRRHGLVRALLHLVRYLSALVRDQQLQRSDILPEFRLTHVIFLGDDL